MPTICMAKLSGYPPGVQRRFDEAIRVVFWHYLLDSGLGRFGLPSEIAWQHFPAPQKKDFVIAAQLHGGKIHFDGIEQRAEANWHI